MRPSLLPFLLLAPLALAAPLNPKHHGGTGLARRQVVVPPAVVNPRVTAAPTRGVVVPPAVVPVTSASVAVPSTVLPAPVVPTTTSLPASSASPTSEPTTSPASSETTTSSPSSSASSSNSTRSSTSSAPSATNAFSGIVAAFQPSSSMFAVAITVCIIAGIIFILCLIALAKCIAHRPRFADVKDYPAGLPPRSESRTSLLPHSSSSSFTEKPPRPPTKALRKPSRAPRIMEEVPSFRGPSPDHSFRQPSPVASLHSRPSLPPHALRAASPYRRPSPPFPHRGPSPPYPSYRVPTPTFVSPALRPFPTPSVGARLPPSTGHQLVASIPQLAHSRSQAAPRLLSMRPGWQFEGGVGVSDGVAREAV